MESEKRQKQSLLENEQFMKKVREARKKIKIKVLLEKKRKTVKAHIWKEHVKASLLMTCPSCRIQKPHIWIEYGKYLCKFCGAERGNKYISQVNM